MASFEVMKTIDFDSPLPSEPSFDSSTPLISEECFAVVQKLGGEHVRIVKLARSANILVEKLRFEAESAYGHPFGLFEVIGKKLVPTSVEELRRIGEDIEMASVAPANIDEGDNREVIAPSAIDTETRQALTEDQINEMKEEGSRASDVVSKLVEGSASFSTRSKYAKFKYLRRKAKKHSDRVIILKPTIRMLCDAYLRKDFDRSLSLRVDQLSVVLHQGAVHLNKKVIVFDQGVGIISAAVTERLAGSGACIHLHRGSVPQSIPAFHAMEFNEELLASFYPVRLDTILNGFKQPDEEGKEAAKMDVEEYAGNEQEEKRKETKQEEEVEEEEKKKQQQEDRNVEKRTEPPKPYTAEWYDAASRKRHERLRREAEALKMIEEGVDTIIIGTRSVDPCTLLDVVYDKLRLSGHVVVYSPTIQHCLRAQQWLRERGAVHIVFNDQMYRVQQVLPGRTHPLMSQSVVGGYVLAAIKVLRAAPERKD